jgi:phage RecT family recombinase
MPDDQRPVLAQRPGPPATVGELMRREEETTRRLSAVATKHLPAERAAHLAIMAIRKVPLLARCTPASFMGALMGATGLGLEPNTLREHCFLIPYRRREPRRDQNRRNVEDAAGNWIWDEWYECQLQIGYRGFVTLFGRNDLVLSTRAEAIYDVDRFEHRIGTRTYLEYEKAIDRPRYRAPSENDEFGPSPGLRGAFCFTALRDDAQSFTVLGLDDILKARSRSQAWQTARAKVEEARAASLSADNEKKKTRAAKDLAKALAGYAETPWVFSEDQMTAKTAIRRHAKQIDLGADEYSSRISIAADLDALGDAGSIDMEALADPDHAKAVLSGEGDIPRQEADETERGENQAADESGEQGQVATGGEQTGGEQAGERSAAASPSPPPPPAAAAKTGAAPQKDLF